jgi:hypothetical protein
MYETTCSKRALQNRDQISKENLKVIGLSKKRGRGI